MPDSDPYFKPKAEQASSRSWLKIALGVLLLALIALIALRLYQSLTQAARAKPAPVTEVQIKQGELVSVGGSTFEQTLPLSGSLNPYVQTTVRPRASGEVARVLVREGQAVQANQVLAELVNTTYQAQLAQAQANVSSAQRSFDVTLQDYKNNQQLFEEKFISKMALDKLNVNVAAAQTQLDNAKQALVIAKQSASETVIRAPVAGYVASSSAQKGDTVGSDTAMFVIVNIDSFELAAPISAEQVGMIRAGQTVQLSATGIAQLFDGVVERVNPAAQSGSRSYLVYIRVDNPTGLLKAGMFAQGKIVLSTSPNTLSVPATALHTVGGKVYVYKVADGKLVKQFVTIGTRASDAIDAAVEITSGLAANDTVIRLDLGELKEGVSVNILNDAAITPAPAQ
ncbi:nolF secretion protein [Formosimonas limnophila]|uniref:NolF secretion protein n=1 Tax=Formosimonas limnophila TaxID=1384487 RepID=A0A8J3CMK9_9BURK|nr:efflux RND transporter periplasmic adaptor subunit [Formosimonas limnophila]GHA79019.1 nolF secretion protein [Formosimonas limnophila]